MTVEKLPRGYEDLQQLFVRTKGGQTTTFCDTGNERLLQLLLVIVFEFIDLFVYLVILYHVINC